MSDLIALHWGFDEITAVAPAKGRESHAAILRKPEAVTNDPAALGRWLKAELASKRLTGRRAAIVLPRAAAIFRKLTLPDLPDDELPDVVRMQAATKSPTPLDRLRLDFVPLPRRGEGREVLLATVPAKTIDDVLAAVRAAGLEPAAVGLSPFGVAAKVAGDGEPTLVVAVNGQTAEITLVRDGAVHFSHAADLPDVAPDEDRQWLSSEVSRAVVAADHLAASGGISRVVLLGPSILLEPLRAPLAERYGGRTELIDDPRQLGVASDADGAAVAAIAAAAGQLQGGAPPRLDFLAPRKRIEKPDRRRLHLALAGGGLVAAAAAAYGMSLLNRADLDDRIANLTSENVSLGDVLKRGQPTRDAKDAVDGWLAGQAEWRDQLAALDEALPGTDRIYLTELAFVPARDSLGVIIGKGAARDQYDVRALYEALAGQGYRVNPRPVVESIRDPDYPVRFEIDLAIPRPKAAEAAPNPTTRATASST